MNFAQKAQEIIRRETISLIIEDWKSVYMTVLVAVKDLSTSYECTYTDSAENVEFIPGYGDGWDLHVLIGEWYKSDHKINDAKHKWNKIQFEINH